MSKELFDKFMLNTAHLDRLIKEGEGDGPTADIVRDEMDSMWYALTPRERELLRKQARNSAQNETPDQR